MFSDHKKQSEQKKEFEINHDTLFTYIFLFICVFLSLAVKQADKIFLEHMLIDQMNLPKSYSSILHNSREM